MSAFGDWRTWLPRLAGLYLVTVSGCVPAVPAGDAGCAVDHRNLCLCERTAEDPRGTCPVGWVCGGDGLVTCEPGTPHCVCMDGVCGAATCVREADGG